MSLDDPSAVVTLPGNAVRTQETGAFPGVVLRHDGTNIGPDYVVMMDQGAKDKQNDRAALIRISDVRRLILAVDGEGRDSGPAADIVVDVVAREAEHAPTTHEELSTWINALSNKITAELKLRGAKKGAVWSLAVNAEGGIFLAHVGDAGWLIPRESGEEPLVSRDYSKGVQNFMAFHGSGSPSTGQRDTLGGLLRGAEAIAATEVSTLRDVPLSEAQLAELAGFTRDANIVLDCSNANRTALPFTTFHKSTGAVWVMVKTDGVSGVASMKTLSEMITDAEDGHVLDTVSNCFEDIINRADDDTVPFAVPFNYGDTTLHVKASGDNRGLVVARMTPLPKSKY